MILCLLIVLEMEDQVKCNALWDTVFLTVFFVINCAFWPFTHSIHQCIWCTIHTQFCRNQKTMQLWTQPLCTVHCKFYWHLDSGARLNWSILDMSSDWIKNHLLDKWTGFAVSAVLCKGIYFFKDFRVEKFFLWTSALQLWLRCGKHSVWLLATW